VCADLLAEFDPGTATGTGFLFDPGDPDALGRAVKRAIRAYAAEEAFATLVDRAMGFAMSWRDAARRHANLYRELVTRTAVRAA
jgi:glycogen synthase